MLNELADEAANVGLVAVANDPPRMIYRFLQDPTCKSRSDVRVRKKVVDRFLSFVARQQERLGATSKTQPISPTALLNQVREFSSGLVRTSLPRVVLTNNF